MSLLIQSLHLLSSALYPTQKPFIGHITKADTVDMVYMNVHLLAKFILIRKNEEKKKMFVPNDLSLCVMYVIHGCQTSDHDREEYTHERETTGIRFGSMPRKRPKLPPV